MVFSIQAKMIFLTTLNTLTVAVTWDLILQKHFVNMEQNLKRGSLAWSEFGTFRVSMLCFVFWCYDSTMIRTFHLLLGYPRSQFNLYAAVAGQLTISGNELKMSVSGFSQFIIKLLHSSTRMFCPLISCRFQLFDQLKKIFLCSTSFLSCQKPKIFNSWLRVLLHFLWSLVMTHGPVTP